MRVRRTDLSSNHRRAVLKFSNTMKKGAFILLAVVFAHVVRAGTGDSSSVKKPGGDQTKKEKPPKHYLYNTIYTEYYSTPKRDITTKSSIKLGQYSFSQSNTGFYFPMKTRDIRKDSVTIANVHTLIVGNFLKAMPHFDSLTDHHLTAASLGLRVMYNNGKKNVWFFNLTPTWMEDDRSTLKTSARLTSLFVFNHTYNKNFSLRVGFTRTYIYGNLQHLPVAGVRFGPLDGVYVRLDWPRNYSLNFPVGKKFYGSVYCKPFGGIYHFANSDTFYNGDSLYNGHDAFIKFGRREFLTGGKLEYNASRNFCFFVSSGISMINQLAFFSGKANVDRTHLKSLTPFYAGTLSNAYFINFGLTWRFGKVKMAYNNYTMYDLFDMNNTFDPGDVNDGAGNGNIPPNGKRTSIKDLQYKDVQDLIELDDSY